MQLHGPTPTQVPPLPAAPPLDRWLFEQPLPLAAAIAAAGLLLGLVLLKRGRRVPSALMLVVGLGGAAGAILIGALIETPRETLRRLSAELAAATAAADTPAMTRLLEPGAAVLTGTLRNAGAFSLDGRDRIINAVESMGAVGGVSVLETRSTLDGPRVGRSHIRVRVLDQQGSWLGHSWWELDWVRRDDGWRVQQITPLWIQTG